MKYKLFFVFFGIHLSFLFGGMDIIPYKNPISRDTIIVKKITDIVSQKLLIEQNLHLIGTGSQMMNEIEMLGMSFNFFNELDITAARKLLLKSIQEYLTEINSSAEIRNYLKNYPFTANNVELHIWLHKPDGSLVSKNKPSYISSLNGILYYNFDDPKLCARNTLHQETYEEALKIIESSLEKSLLPKDSLKIPQANIIS